MKTMRILTLIIIAGFITMHSTAQQPATAATKVKAGYGEPVVQTEPEFPGGKEALTAYLHENLKFPADLRENKSGGRVIITFIIDKEGKIIEPLVMRGLNDAANEEALRVVKSMPAWKPGTTGGVPVNKQYILPIDFVIPSI